MINSILQYLTYPVNVSYSSVKFSPAEFPAVTLCNLNSFDVTTDIFATKYIDDTLLANRISPLVKLSTSDLAMVKVNEAATILKSAVTADTALNSSYLKKLGFTMETMLISCYYNGIKCSPSNFSWFRTFEYGNCYTFNGLTDSNGNSMDALTTSKSGPSSGLVMELFVGAPGNS